MSKLDEVFQQRLQRHHDELRWLYMELYENDSMTYIKLALGEDDSVEFLD